MNAKTSDGRRENESHVCSVLESLNGVMADSLRVQKSIRNDVKIILAGMPRTGVATKHALNTDDEVVSEVSDEPTQSQDFEGSTTLDTKQTGIIKQSGSREDFEDAPFRSERARRQTLFRQALSGSILEGDRIIAHCENHGVGMSLPENWPCCLKVRQLWVVTGTQSRGTACLRGYFDDGRNRPPSPIPFLRRGSTLRKTAREMIIQFIKEASSKQIDPCSATHVFFGIVGLLLLIHDLSMIPFALAWDLPFTGYVKISGILSALFWITDCILTFFRGYTKDGHNITDIKSIARHYLRTWFLPDISIIVCDVVSISMELVYGGSEGRDMAGLKMLRFARAGRLARIAGAMRVLRFVKRLQDMTAAVLSDKLHFMFYLIGLLSACLWVAHCVSCAWVAVGFQAPSDSGSHWVDFEVSWHGEDCVFKHLPIMYQYATAYHWTLAQLSLGASDLICRSSFERFFNIICLYCGMFGGSGLISLLSGLMVEFFVRHREGNENMRVLRRYLRQTHASTKLARTVVQNTLTRLRAKTTITEDMVTALRPLSSALRASLRYNTTKHDLLRVPLLKVWQVADFEWFQNMVFEAVSVQALILGDELFRAAEVALGAHIISSGSLKYTQTPASSLLSTTTEQFVSRGHVLCESGLWCEWYHVGVAEAQQESTVLQISEEQFGNCVSKHVIIKPIAQAYGQAYYKRIVQAAPPITQWPNDCYVPFTEFGEVVHFMPECPSTFIGLQALFRRGAWSPRLEEEIRSGSCSAMVDEFGVLFRVVSLVALEIKCEDKIFVEVGRKTHDIISERMQLPGQKLDREQSLAGAFEEIINKKLLPLKDNIRLVGTRADSKQMLSKEFRLQTKYMRHICEAISFREIDCDTCTVRLDEVFPTGSISSVNHCFIQAMGRLKVYTIDAGNQDQRFYAWLTKDQMDEYSKPSYASSVRTWLMQCVPRPGFDSDLTAQAECVDI